MKSINEEIRVAMRNDYIWKQDGVSGDRLSRDKVRFYVVRNVWAAVGSSVWVPIADC